MDNLENKTAQVILQQPVEVVIGYTTYKVAPPTIATLILASAAISKLPHEKLKGESIMLDSLYIAKDCEALGEIVAILILGAKNLVGTEKVIKKRFFGLYIDEYEVTINKKDILATEVLEELTPKQLSDTLLKLFDEMDLSFFFGTIDSLIEINLLRKTKEAAKTTASGQ